MSNEFKKLIRNIRKKQYEKIRFIRNNAPLNDREESQEGKVPPTKDIDLRKKRDR